MSSFRIDRQYVSFVSAEAHTVITGKQHKKEPEADKEKEEKKQLAAEEFRLHCEQLREKIVKEAEDKADLIVQKAENEAKEIRAEAEKKISLMMEEANKKAEALKKKAKTDGQNEGIKIAEQIYEAKRKQDEADLQAIISKLHASYGAMVDQMKDEILNLVFGIVKKIINIKLDESDEVFINLINSAVENLKYTGTSSIYISPEDYKRYFGKEPRELTGGSGKVNVYEKEDFKQGDLVVESDGEILDYSIGRQVAKLEKVFREARN